VVEEKSVKSMLYPSMWACREASGWAVIVCLFVVVKNSQGVMNVLISLFPAALE